MPELREGGSRFAVHTGILLHGVPDAGSSSRYQERVVANKAGKVSLLKKEIAALEQAHTKQEKNLKETEAEITRLKTRERSGIPWRNPENAAKMFVSVGRAQAANKTCSSNRDGSEWVLGDSPLEALGSLVMQMALHRPVMAVDFERKGQGF